MASTIKVDQIQSDTGTVNLASNLAFSSAFSMSGPVTLNSPTIATPTMTGQAVIPSINLTSGQIVFPATQNASSNANTLDDYEEGTFTPSAESQSGVITSFSSNGSYTKIGRSVFIQGRIVVTNVGTASGILLVGSLPFILQSIPGRPFVGVSREDNTTGNTFLSYGVGNSTTFAISALTSVGGISWVNGYTYIFSFTYQVA
jgi:hypothetical protein